MKEFENTGVVILAAGASERLGRAKQLIEFQGKPLLEYVIDQFEEIAISTRILVLGAFADVIQKSVNTGSFKIVINENWQEGMASSIREGLQSALNKEDKTERLLFVLSDQPYVTKTLFEKLLQMHTGGNKAITACGYQNAIGAPAVFSKSMFSELLSLQGAQGAGRLIKKYPDKVNVLPFEKGAIDIDTPEDLNTLNGPK